MARRALSDSIEGKPDTVLSLIHDLALGEQPKSALGRRYSLSPAGVTAFGKRHQLEIDEHKAKLSDQLINLYIKQLDWRLGEYQHDALLLRGKKDPQAVKARVAILHAAAEELGQLPGRTNVIVVPVQHVIEGVDVAELT